MSKILNTSKFILPNARIAIIFLIVLFVILIGYFKILTNQIIGRAYIDATQSNIEQRLIVIGSNGYGQINSIRVTVGQNIGQGDTLFTYLRVDSNGLQEVPVRSIAPGKVMSLKFGLGSYITPDSSVMELQSRDVSIRSKIKIDVKELSKIKIGSESLTVLPSGNLTKGTVSAIYPVFDKIDGTIEIESKPGIIQEEIISGTPVQTKVFVGDTLSENTTRVIEQIPIPQVRDYFLQ
jgi:hypothetical protein